MAFQKVDIQAPNPGPSLLSLRWLLFFFFGAVGSLLPFLSLHSRAIGLTLEEARIISYASPLIAFLGPLIAGPILDSFYRKKKQTEGVKLESNSCIRLSLAFCILIATIAYSLLLAVPRVEHMHPRQPDIMFACSPQGASLVQERCNEAVGCYQYNKEKKGEIRLDSCSFDCSKPFESRYWQADSLEQVASTNVPPAESQESGTTTTTAATTTTTTSASLRTSEQPIRVSMVTDLDTFFGRGSSAEEDDDDDFGSGEDIDGYRRRRRAAADPDEEEYEEVTVDNSDPAGDDDLPPPHICFGPDSKRMCSVFTPYSTSVRVDIALRQSFADEDFCYYPLGGHFSCNIPVGLQSTKNCKVICKLDNPYESGGVLLQSQCQLMAGDPQLTFWLYFACRTIGDMFTAISISLLIGAVLMSVRDAIGMEFLAPTASYALFASLVGYFQSSGLSPLQLTHLPPYFLAIAGFALLSVLSLFVLLFATEMPIGLPDWWTLKTDRIRHKSELFGLLVILTLLGILWGPLYYHVPWHMEGTSNLEAYLGTSVAIGALLSLPFACKSFFIVDFCGYANLLIVAFTFYILRYTGLLFLKTPWVLFITGGLEVFTLTLMLFSAVLYIRQLVPKNYTFTAQSLGFAAHFCLGNGLGCLIASYVSPSENDLSNFSEAANATGLTNVSSSSTEKPLDVGVNDWDTQYGLLYCGAAVFSAVVAALYFVIYHCCFKTRCLAPNYRKSQASTPPIVQSSSNNGTYTPLLVYSNGRQPPLATD